MEREEVQFNIHIEIFQPSMAEERDECCDGQLSFNVSNVIEERSLNGGECKNRMGERGKVQ